MIRALPFLIASSNPFFFGRHLGTRNDYGRNIIIWYFHIICRLSWLPILIFQSIFLFVLVLVFAFLLILLRFLGFTSCLSSCNCCCCSCHLRDGLFWLLLFLVLLLRILLLLVLLVLFLGLLLLPDLPPLCFVLFSLFLL